MRPVGVAATLAVLVAVGATLLMLRGRFVDAGTGPVAAEAPALREEPVSRPAPRASPRVRPVAPERVALPEVAPEALERIEERAPLGPIGRAQAPSEGGPKPTILHRPLAVSAGVFQSRGHTVALAGIDPPAADEECVSGGVAWLCGVHARTAFRNWLRGRALTCVVPPVPAPETVVTECMLGKQDAAAWLVAQGWARALPDGPYAQAEASARAAGRGLFGPAPTLPEPAAAPEPSSGG